jgi:cytochrome c oxidase subunit 2
MKLSISAGLLLLAATIQAWAGETPSAALLETCTACHGDQGQGNAALGAPRLAGQQVGYLAQQLRNFASGRRGYDAQDPYGAQMRAVVANLDEAELEPLARYYSSLNLALPKNPITENASLGKSIYQGSCAACHGLKGEGFAHLKTPNLRILDAPYLERQLVNYTEGVRGGEAHADQLGIWMRGISLQIGGSAERRALSDYMGSLSAETPIGGEH